MTPTATATAYLAVWNEPDAAARARLLAETWTPDATYVDPLGAAPSPGALSETIGGVHSRFPGFRFALIGAPDGHGDHIRFTWGLGPEGQEPPVIGTDIVRLRGGKIAEVVGFLDKVPAA